MMVKGRGFDRDGMTSSEKMRAAAAKNRYRPSADVTLTTPVAGAVAVPAERNKKEVKE